MSAPFECLTQLHVCTFELLELLAYFPFQIVTGSNLMLQGLIAACVLCPEHSSMSGDSRFLHVGARKVSQAFEAILYEP